MSTRSQIEFKHITIYSNKKKQFIERRTIYKHSDGYPSGNIPLINEFMKWNKGRNSDIEYQTANFIYYCKRQYEELYFNRDYAGKEKEPNKKWSDIGESGYLSLLIGFGICENDELHGDIEYYYEVVRETLINVIDKIPRDSTTKTYINVYQVPYDKKVCKENLILLEKIEEKDGNFITKLED